jgi:hypothetical protein
MTRDLEALCAAHSHRMLDTFNGVSPRFDMRMGTAWQSLPAKFAMDFGKGV